jgi:hypothetical protein
MFQPMKEISGFSVPAIALSASPRQAVSPATASFQPKSWKCFSFYSFFADT